MSQAMPQDDLRMRQDARPPNRALFIIQATAILVPLLSMPVRQPVQDVALKVLQVLCAFLCGALILQTTLRFSGSKFFQFLGTGANLAILLYFAAAVLSFLLGTSDPDIRKQGLSQLQGTGAGLVLYFAAAYYVRRSRHLEELANALIYLLGFMAIIGLSFVAMQQSSYRANVFGDPQLYGAFMMALLPIPIVVAVTEQEPRRKMIALVSAALSVIGVFMSGTRSAWIGTFVALAAMALFSAARPKNSPRQNLSKSQLIIPILTIVACIGFAAVQGDIMSVITRRLAAGDSTLMVRQRQHWGAALELIRFNPILGLGPSTYAAYQNVYSHFGRPGYVVLESRPALSENAHNIWLQTAVEQGLLGASLLAAVIATFLVAGLRRLRQLPDGTRRALLLAAMGSAVGFSIDGISNPAWEFPQIAMFLWLMLGIGVACLQARPEAEE